MTALSELNYWWGLGRRADRGRAERRIASALVCVGTAVMILVALGLAIGAASYEARLDRDWARIPNPELEGAPNSQWLWMADDADGMYVDVIAIVPLTEEAPLPPGLQSWPESGEVVLSPALVGTAAGEQIVARYGVASDQTISISGLTDPGERIAYFVPLVEIDGDSAVDLTSYGLDQSHRSVFSSGQLGSGLRQLPIPVFIAVYASLSLAPALVLMRVAARAGGARRDRRVSVLGVLGLRARHRLPLLAGALVPPMIAGTGLGCLLVLPWLVVDVKLPGSGYTILAADMRAHAAWLAVAAAIGLALSIGIVLVANRAPRRYLATTPRPGIASERLWKVLLLPAACWFLTLGFQLAIPYGAVFRTLFFYAALLLVMVALPSFVGTVTAVIARLVAGPGKRLVSPGVLVAMRQILGDPAAVRRLAAAMGLAVLITGQLLVWTTTLSDGEVVARDIRSRVGQSLATFDPSPPPWGDQMKAVLDGAEVVMLSYADEDQNVLTVDGSCDALTALELPCDSSTAVSITAASEPRLAIMAGLVGAQQVSAVTLDLYDSGTELPDAVAYFMISPDGTDLEIERMREQFAAMGLPPDRVAPVADSWAIAGQDDLAKSR